MADVSRNIQDKETTSVFCNHSISLFGNPQAATVFCMCSASLKNISHPKPQQAELPLGKRTEVGKSLKDATEQSDDNNKSCHGGKRRTIFESVS